MSDNVSPLGPREKKMYEQEYKHSAELFKQSLNEFIKSDNAFQKDEYKDVMNQAMQVLNETARELKRNDLLKQNQTISEDFQIFQEDPKNAKVQKTLQQDLDHAKRSIH